MMRMTIAGMLALMASLPDCGGKQDDPPETIDVPLKAVDDSPKTVAEAKKMLFAAVSWPTPNNPGPGYRRPPGNVQAEDYMELFGDTVMVASEISRDGANHIDVQFIGRDGHQTECRYSPRPYGPDRSAVIRFKWDAVRRSDNSTDHYSTFKVRETRYQLRDARHGFSPLYDGETGEIIWYGFKSKYSSNPGWRTYRIGHLQERIPVVTWTICPDFPSADELGVEINHAQTSGRYDELVAQDSGRRVLRPDLVTPDVHASR